MLPKRDLAQKQITIGNSQENGEDEQRRKARRAVAALLAVTVGLALLFHFLSFLPDIWRRFNSPAIIRSDIRGQSTKRLEGSSDLRRGITKLIGNKEGVYGVYIIDLRSGGVFGINEEETFPAASLIKLPLIYAFYQQVEQGRVDPNGRYFLKDEDRVMGTGSIYQQPAGTVYRLHDLAVLLGKQSDNTAQHILTRILGKEKIQAVIADLGMRQTSWFNQETTPRDIAVFWQALASGRVLTPGHRRDVLNSLTDTIFEKQIPAGLPRGVRVAHKVAIDRGILHDAGVIFADRPFVLVLMSKNVDVDEARKLFPQITKLVWNEMRNS